MGSGGNSESAMRIVVVGGGPAGSAAAISCARQGCEVTLLEESSPKEKPGEALHPGVEPLLEQLGALDVLREHEWVRYSGIRIRQPDGRERFDTFGADAGGPWLGYQVE